MKKILFIEDDKTLRSLYAETFGEEGYEVLVAANGAEGLELMRSQNVDLVITDLRMPQTDGRQVLTSIVGMRKGLPTIVYTAYPEYRSHPIGWMADAYVVKSSNFDELRQKIEELLSR